MDLEEKLERIPDSPGVYLMKGAKGEILYIGKAKSLRPRVRSYFRKSADTRYAVKFLALKVRDIDYIVTTNEKEALILEETLLKKHRPRYNIRLKDDKTYLSIKITTKEKFPRIFTTRRIVKDGSRYFGPYASAAMARETVRFLRRIFPLCVCGPSEFRNRVRPCLDHQLGICTAPAVGLIDEDEYREIVNGAIMFLEGKNRTLVKLLKADMKASSNDLDFEGAAIIRDRINAIEATLEEQKVVSARGRDKDIIATARDGDTLEVQLLFIRDGRLVGSKSYGFTDALLPDDELISSFISRFYQGERFIPDEILVEVNPIDRDFLAEWLREKKGKKVTILRPERGEKLKLLKMCAENASEALKERRGAGEAADVVTGEVKKRLRLTKAPERIEAYDISTLGGSHSVGAMVSFFKGRPDKNNYRLYKIKHVEGQNDFAMLFEVLKRRFSSSLQRPDMILIDGGKGQLSMAVEVLKELRIDNVEARSIAKERELGPKENTAEASKATGAKQNSKGERVFIPNVKDPVPLREGYKADNLIISIRDEVHRRAVSYHRKLRKNAIGSTLDRVPGIGAKRRKALFDSFVDIEGIRKAGVKELSSIPGITEEMAKKIKREAGRG